MNRADAAAAAGLLSLGACFLPAVIEANSEAANRTKCANNLRQLGLAALQYGDDKRFLPHNTPIRQLDGDATTNHTPKIARALVWYGYHDKPEGFVCRSSDDRSLSINDDGVRRNMRGWFWGRAYKSSSPTSSPFVQGGDPALNTTRELSYGWTRRGMNSNIRSTATLGADRAARDGKATGVMQGNHGAGWNVLSADATVHFRKASDPLAGGDTGAFLAGTGKAQGYLAIRPQQAATMKGLTAKPPTKTPWAGVYSDGVVVIELEARSWDPYRARWSFSGTLYRRDRRFPLFGTAGTGGLKGTMEGARTMPITLVAGPGSLEIGSEGLQRRLERKPDLWPKTVERLFRALETGSKAKAAACLSKRLKQELDAKAARAGTNWFVLLQAHYVGPAGSRSILARRSRLLRSGNRTYVAGRPKVDRLPSR